MSKPNESKPTTPAEELLTRGGHSAEGGPELTIWEVTYSAKEVVEILFILIPVSVLLVGGAIYGVMNYEFVSQNSYYVWWGLALVIVLLWGIPTCKVAYKKMSYHYKLTNQRLVHREGFFIRQTDQVELFDIRDVTYKQNLIESFLGVGTIIIQSVDKSHPTLKLEGIANVKDRTDEIDRTRREIQAPQRLRMDS